MEELTKIVELIRSGALQNAKEIAREYYPFNPQKKEKRKYTPNDMYKVFCRDKFTDRYSGEKLYNPGLLKMLNYFLPEEFPYHQHGKSEECHLIYWDCLPSIDHVIPLARGGQDNMENWVTTTQKRNIIKNNWMVEELGWTLHEISSESTWDGGTKVMIEIYEMNQIQDKYITSWYKLAKKTPNI